MKVTYQANDGYAGGARPLRVQVDDSEIESSESIEDAIEYVEDVIRDDFEQRVSPGYNLGEIRKEVEAIWNKANPNGQRE